MTAINRQTFITFIIWYAPMHLAIPPILSTSHQVAHRLSRRHATLKPEKRKQETRSGLKESEENNVKMVTCAEFLLATRARKWVSVPVRQWPCRRRRHCHLAVPALSPLRRRFCPCCAVFCRAASVCVLSRRAVRAPIKAQTSPRAEGAGRIRTRPSALLLTARRHSSLQDQTLGASPHRPPP